MTFIPHYTPRAGDKVRINPRTLELYPELATEYGLTTETVGEVVTGHRMGIWQTLVDFGDDRRFGFEPHELIKVQS